MMEKLAGLIERLRAWDAAAARNTLDHFERVHGLDHEPAVVRSGTIADVQDALKPRGRPVIEHHWATWCEPCLDELPQIQAIEAAVRGRADVIGVSWERFTDDRGAEAAVEKVAKFMASRGLTFRTIVVDNVPDDLMVELDLPATTIPQTRVYDARGVVIGAFPEPLDLETAAQVRALVGVLN